MSHSYRFPLMITNLVFKHVHIILTSCNFYYYQYDFHIFCIKIYGKEMNNDYDD